MSDNENIIELIEVYKSFDSKAVHKGLNLTVKAGENITVLGGSGGGKSVLLKEINGLITPDSGDVIVMGKNIVTMNENELTEIRKDIGMLFQGSALFDSLTVEENIAYPLIENYDLDEDEIKKIVAEDLERVGLPGIEDKYPSDLSGGMKKRVGLARAIATKPKILLYDEPTTGLDPPNISRINELVKSMRDELGITGIVITHDLQSAYEVSDRIAFLYNGKIIFTGTVEETWINEIEEFRNFIEGKLDEA
ncbi:MAG: ATP-binding cassette domain-containing protein [Candidatus Dadabacteria bacterium]|nr:ATP-binding cassette domain-containing protein [Candidatus Dadabacteria bacterium]NIQ13209.1 ATP-binding cassette domain-containing protein [Candidatus Dadabacteria bacterium]